MAQRDLQEARAPKFKLPDEGDDAPWRGGGTPPTGGATPPHPPAAPAAGTAAPVAKLVTGPGVASRLAPTATPVAAGAKFQQPSEALPALGENGLLTDRQGRPLPNMPMLPQMLSSRIQQYVDSYIDANPQLNQMDPARVATGIMAGSAWKQFLAAVTTHLKTLNPASRPPDISQALAQYVSRATQNAISHNNVRAGRAQERQAAAAATQARMEQPPAGQPQGRGVLGGVMGGIKSLFGGS